MPLGKVLRNWDNIDGTEGTGEKKLCQEDWPVLIQEDTPAERWPPQGTFDQQELIFLRQHLEDRFPEQMDYWYVWANWAFTRQKEKIKKSLCKSSFTNTTCVSSAKMFVESAPRYAPLSTLASLSAPLLFSRPPHRWCQFWGQLCLVHVGHPRWPIQESASVGGPKI